MLKEIIKKCASLIGRDDIIVELEKKSFIDEIENPNLRFDIIRFMHYFNTISSGVFESHLKLEFCEKIASNSVGGISFNRFSRKVVKVLKIQDENGREINFTTSPFAVITNFNNRLFTVTYNYVPNRVNDLSDYVEEFPIDYETILCYGMIMEFLSSAGKYSESEFWRDKFCLLLFNLDSKRERRVKSTYCV